MHHVLQQVMEKTFEKNITHCKSIPTRTLRAMYYVSGGMHFEGGAETKYFVDIFK